MTDLASRIRPHATRDEWLAGRGIGASEVAAIRGRSPFAGPWAVWVRRQPGVQRTPLTPRQAEGIRYEEIVVREYEDVTGRAVAPADHVVVVHPELPWATCSPDGWVWDEPVAASGFDWSQLVAHIAGGFEAKTDAVNHGWGPTGTIVKCAAEIGPLVPPPYDDQVYWSLEVTRLPFWDIAAWIPQRWGFPRLVWLRVLPDPDHQAQLVEDVAAFRDRYLVGDEEPPIDGSDACAQWNSHRPGPDHKRTHELDPDDPLVDLVVEYIAADQHAKAAVHAHKLITAELHRAFGPDTHKVRLPRSGVRCTRVGTQGGGHRFVITTPKETR